MIRRVIRMLFRTTAVLMLCGVAGVVVLSRFVPEGRGWCWTLIDQDNVPPKFGEIWLRRDGVEVSLDRFGFVSQPEIAIDLMSRQSAWGRLLGPLLPTEYHVFDAQPWWEVIWENGGPFWSERVVRMHMFVLIPVGVASAALFWFGGGWVGRRRRNREGHCPTCGYDLRATPERCPECGWGVERATTLPE